MTTARGTLALRISVLAAAVAVITALIGGLIAVPLIRQATESGARQTLSGLADDLASQAATQPYRSLVALRRLKIDSADVTARGRTVSTSQPARDALTPGQIQTVLSGNPVSAVQKVDGQTMLVEARPVGSGGFVLVQPESDAVSTGDTVIRRILLALIIAGAVAVVLGLIVSRRLARPLARTAQAAHALSVGQRDVIVTPEGPREVAEVAVALNTLRDSLAHSELRQKDFLLSVSHDLRTPLTTIGGYAEGLANGMVEREDMKRVGEVMVEETARLDKYVGDLLDLARLQADQLRIEMSDVDLTNLLDDTGAVWSSRCREAGIPMTVERPPGAVWVTTDPARLRQAIDSLLDNATRVVPPGHPIILSSRQEIGQGGTSGVVEIRDGGPGFSDSDLPVVFERSALRDRYRDTRKVNTGLGLAIVHQIVARLGGTIEAGHAPEGGARFTIRLPGARNGFVSPA